MGAIVVIMAGGRGERFWPCSRENLPKQFLALGGGESLLQRTFNRISRLCPPEKIWVATRRDYTGLVRDQLPDLWPARIIAEPTGRDTAACVALASVVIGKQDPTATMIMVPADHWVSDDGEFCATLERALEVARQSDVLVTLGLKPSRPETAYGYIRVGERFSTDTEAYCVEQFTEKPVLEKALSYLQTGGYFWNSGVFVWRVPVIKEALKRFLPELMAGLRPVEEAVGTEHETAVLEAVYPTLARTSIDYGVMERASNVVMVPARFGWDDLGTWTALERSLPLDESGNVTHGNVLSFRNKESILYGNCPGRLVAVYGLNGVVVVDTEDVVLVADKSCVSDLKGLVGELPAAGLERFLQFQTREERGSAGECK